MERGTLVKVTVAGGGTACLIVWERSEKVVLLTNEEQYSRLRAGLPALTPVAFALEDVGLELNGEA